MEFQHTVSTADSAGISEETRAHDVQAYACLCIPREKQNIYLLSDL